MGTSGFKGVQNNPTVISCRIIAHLLTDSNASNCSVKLYLEFADATCLVDAVAMIPCPLQHMESINFIYIVSLV